MLYELLILCIQPFQSCGCDVVFYVYYFVQDFHTPSPTSKISEKSSPLALKSASDLIRSITELINRLSISLNLSLFITSKDFIKKYE